MTESAARELHELAVLAGRGAAGVTSLIRGVHVAIADRAFRATGSASRPVRLWHGAITSGVYAAVSGGMRVAAHGAGLVAAARTQATAPRPTDAPRLSEVVGAVNGAWGDRLATWRSPLAFRMSLRADGRDVAPTADALRAAYPSASDDVVVFVHGLCETERWWRHGARDHWQDETSTHGSRLAAEHGSTPVYLRYNTGLHVCDNGDALGMLLTELVTHWPTPVTRLTLVGHSMGGLVIRAACHAGLEHDQPWVALVRRVVYLGAPHLGAPLELAAAATTSALRRLPETRPVAQALASRSVGVKDLRFGAVRAADWADVDDLDRWRREPPECAPLLETAEHFYVGVTIGRRHDTLAARVIGDALVPFASASGTGRRRRLALDADRGRHLGGLHHFDLLNHPRVYAVLRDWLAP